MNRIQNLVYKYIQRSLYNMNVIHEYRHMYEHNDIRVTHLLFLTTYKTNTNNIVPVYKSEIYERFYF